MERIYLSTVTPVYRGAKYLREVVRELEAVRNLCRERDLPVELIESIFVDDASVDDSAAILEELQQGRPWVRVLHLSRNAGQHGATVAGILHASGDWVATLDEDMQHHPSHLLRLLTHAASGHFDVVYAAPTDSVHDSAFRNWSSRTYKRLVSWLAGNPVITRFSSYRMMRGTVVRAACSVSTYDTYFDVVLNWFTGRIDSHPLPLHDPRANALETSGYSFARLVQHARRMLISSEIKPLRYASALGILTLLVSIFLACTIVVLKVLRPETIELRGWASLILTISFFGGLTAFLVGIVLEYLSTLVQHTLGKPAFFVVDRRKDDLLASMLMPEKLG